MVLTPSFTHLSITFSNQRFSNCSPTVDVGFVKLTSDSFCGNRVFKMNIQFCCHQFCSSSVIFLNNVWRSLCVNFDFGPLFLSDDVVFPLLLYADITLESVALDTPNNVAVSVTDATAKQASTICPFLKSDKSPVFLFLHTDCHSTQSLMHWHEHYRM
jgi:hypothetical protein